ncbi:4-hydroxy-3-methylbut-2-enyl diphosphate reductase [Brucepastera parasyntrophica]|uniref:4-hydroxy-3-methylbut-2-enyl diphosphate reductase n=1 Tax=Brucepastera parasyntrophica TaxID=2880008 RepID=UPI00210EB66B|nr:4-hydroxy-3-methylbut-2-enyl diphosphate reductase [Brucepastera parasyntrophica]ULQ60366.1 4-hydroxy-3-methylbut-2-enyl diphosphate reductase [Brucepastera parasyntrophica]
MNHERRIIRAEILGYCMGVRRAVEAAEQALLENPLRPVYTYGPLIHNSSALERLSAAGIIILNENEDDLPEDFGGKTVVIRAHGVPPSVRTELERRNACIVDATCPRVLSSQKRAKSYSEKGYTVILVGDKNHGEIAGIAGYAPGCIVLENREDVLQLKSYPQKSVLISQTTISQNEYDAIAEELSRHIPYLTVFNTICPATLERQDALRELAGQVEGIIVIGGKNSANTLRLYNTACELSGRVWHIENPDEMPEEIFFLTRIGITAGASTPDDLINSVEQALQKV